MTTKLYKQKMLNHNTIAILKWNEIEFLLINQGLLCKPGLHKFPFWDLCIDMASYYYYIIIIIIHIIIIIKYKNV